MGTSKTATFTLFYTDIEGSTLIAKSLGRDYAVVLDKHNQIITSNIEKFRGRIIDRAGDGFFIVFKEPLMALKAAAKIQMEFQDASFSFSVSLKIRIAIHYGQVYPVGDLYTGLEIHKVSRICNACHGGQVLLSGQVVKILGNDLPEYLSIKTLGKYKLRDFDETVELNQLIISGLTSQFPEPNTDSEMPVVAVIPIINSSNDPEMDYFSDGITEDLIISLGRLRSVRVISRSSVFSFKGKEVSPVDIGQKLGASTVLAGSVRFTNSQIILNIELIEVRTGINLWVNKYEKPKKEILAIQDDITKNVIDTLNIEIKYNSERQLQTAQTDKIEAYEYYLQGRRYYDLYSLKSIKYAIEMFQKAIDIDFRYALAYCGLADCYSYLYMYHEASDDNLELAEMTSRTAVKLGPTLAEAYVSRGMVLSLSKNYTESENAVKSK